MFKPYSEGVADSDGANDIVFELPLNTNNANRDYTREGLITAIQTLFDGNELTAGSKISLVNDGNLQYANIRMNVNKTYYASDYKLVFYDAVSFVYCNVGVTQNATWDSTLGWLLGFHSYTEYALGDFVQIVQGDNYFYNVFNSTIYKYTNSYNTLSRKIAVKGDVVLNTNLYNYFLVVLDDFIQNHVNAGLITVASLENDVALPSYAFSGFLSMRPGNRNSDGSFGDKQVEYGFNNQRIVCNEPNHRESSDQSEELCDRTIFERCVCSGSDETDGYDIWPNLYGVWRYNAESRPQIFWTCAYPKVGH